MKISLSSSLKYTALKLDAAIKGVNMATVHVQYMNTRSKRKTLGMQANSHKWVLNAISCRLGALNVMDHYLSHRT